VAYRLGDNTAKEQGRLTLNPIKHIDVFGLLMMIVLKFGWAKPVPVNMMNFKNPKVGMAITALAGPVSNIILAAVMLIISCPLIALAAGSEIAYTLLQLSMNTAYISIALGIFNLIPISPLDGSKIVFSFLPEDTYFKIMRYERYGMILLFIVVWTGILGTPLSNAAHFLYSHMAEGIWSLYAGIFG